MRKKENSSKKTPLIHEKKLIWLDARWTHTSTLLTRSRRGFFLLVGQPHTGAGRAMECLVHRHFGQAEIHRLPDHPQEKSLHIIKVGDDIQQPEELTWNALPHEWHRSRIHEGIYRIIPWTIRSLTHTMARSSLTGMRIIVIDHIQRLNEAASNAFLKMLEELPDNTIVLGSCWWVDTILPTIISRATIIPYPCPDHWHTTSFLSWLLTMHGRLEDRSSTRARLTINNYDTLGCKTLFGSMIGYRYDCIYDFLWWWWSDTPLLIDLIYNIYDAYRNKHPLILSKILVTLPEHRRNHCFAALTHVCTPNHLACCIQAQKRIDANVATEHTLVWLATKLCQ